jgi:hypothetical protein
MISSGRPDRSGVERLRVGWAATGRYLRLSSKATQTTRQVTATQTLDLWSRPGTASWAGPKREAAPNGTKIATAVFRAQPQSGFRAWHMA